MAFREIGVLKFISLAALRCLLDLRLHVHLVCGGVLGLNFSLRLVL